MSTCKVKSEFQEKKSKIHNIELRKWQKEAFTEFQNNNFKGIIEVGTGKGKTIFAGIVLRYLMEREEMKTIIIVPTIDLMRQWKRELATKLHISENIMGQYCGIVHDDFSEKKIMIIVVNSSVKEDVLKIISSHRPEFLIADECHHYGSSVFSKILRLDYKYTLGLSATPKRENDQKGNGVLLENLGKIIYKKSHFDDPESIPEFSVKSIRVTLDNRELIEYRKAEKKIKGCLFYIRTFYGITPKDEHFFEKLSKLKKKKERLAYALIKWWSIRNTIIHNAKLKLETIKHIVKNEKENKIIIFNERINFAKRIFETLKEEGIENCSCIHSKIPKVERKRILEDFENNKIKILVATKVLDEGIDVPDANVAIIASFSKSSRQLVQRDGRVLRLIDDKKYAKRYVLVVKEYGEDAYYTLIKKAGYYQQTLEGEWFDFSNGILAYSQEFKNNAVNHTDKYIRRPVTVKENDNSSQEGYIISQNGYAIPVALYNRTFPRNREHSYNGPISHEERLRRIKEAGLPTVIESGV